MGSMVHTNLNLMKGVGFEQQTGTLLLQKYQSWLADEGPTQCEGDACINYPRGLDLPSADEACLNHLFTHGETDGILGVAIQASPGNVNINGGLCDTIVRISRKRIAVNTAFSNTQGKDGYPVPTWYGAFSPCILPC
jgi:hypothetical protein